MTDDAAGRDAGSSPVGPRFRDAEAWLARRGVPRRPVTDAADGTPPTAAVGLREVARIVAEVPAPPTGVAPGSARHPDVGSGSPDEVTGIDRPSDLGDRIGQAMAYVRRATATTPLSESRVRRGLEQRGFPPVVVEAVLERARHERAVDDDAYAAAFTEERRRQGHAPLRIRRDLERRGFAAETIDRALAPFVDEDAEAQALAVARSRAERDAALPAEKAFRRLAGFLARRGYTDAVARKVAREVVFDVRERQRTAER